MPLDGTVKVDDPYRAQSQGREISNLADRVNAITTLLAEYREQGASLMDSAVGVPPPLTSQAREFQGQVDNLISQLNYLQGRLSEWGAVVVDIAQKHIATTESGAAALNRT